MVVVLRCARFSVNFFSNWFFIFRFFLSTVFLFGSFFNWSSLFFFLHYLWFLSLFCSILNFLFLVYLLIFLFFCGTLSNNRLSSLLLFNLLFFYSGRNFSRCINRCGCSFILNLFIVFLKSIFFVCFLLFIFQLLFSCLV